jgi:hypothetical protein
MTGSLREPEQSRYASCIEVPGYSMLTTVCSRKVIYA